MSIVQQLTHTLAPWQSLYSNNAAISTAVTTTHIVSLLVGGGLAIAADRTTLRALRHETPDWRYHLAELRAVHRPVVAMLAVLFASGVLLAAADIATFAASVVFWIKLTLVALLLANGLFLYRTESHVTANAVGSGDVAEPLRRRLQLSTQLSVGLWLLTAIAGTVLTNG